MVIATGGAKLASSVVLPVLARQSLVVGVDCAEGLLDDVLRQGIRSVPEFVLAVGELAVLVQRASAFASVVSAHASLVLLL